MSIITSLRALVGSRAKTAAACMLPFSGPIKTEAEYAAEANAYIARAKERAATATLDEFSLVKAVDLKAGDVIIHDYARFRITECGCGYFASSEFGDYFWIKGQYLSPYHATTAEDFWSAQCCPMILCKQAATA